MNLPTVPEPILGVLASVIVSALKASPLSKQLNDIVLALALVVVSLGAGFYASQTGNGGNFVEQVSKVWLYGFAFYHGVSKHIKKT